MKNAVLSISVGIVLCNQLFAQNTKYPTCHHATEATQESSIRPSILLTPSTHTDNARTSAVEAVVTDPAQSFRDIYKREWNLDVTCPAFLKEEGEESYLYFSTAWVGDALYIIRLKEDGTYTVEKKTKYNYFPTKGELKTAVICLDYNNSNLTSVHPQLVKQMCDEMNKIHVDYANSLNLAKPIIQYKMEHFLGDGNAYTSSGMNLGNWTKTFLTSKGVRFEDYDLVVVLKLNFKQGGACCSGDKNNVVSVGYISIMPPYVDWTTSSGKAALANIIQAAFIHEGGHFHGWDHDWPYTRNYDFITRPILFGWTDVDGDGVVEILDQTPYGIGATSCTGTVTSAELTESLKEEISIYPNPATSQITILGSTNHDKWTLYNAQGREIAQGKENIINIKEVEDGILFLTISDKHFKVLKQ